VPVLHLCLRVGDKHCSATCRSSRVNAHKRIGRGSDQADARAVAVVADSKWKWLLLFYVGRLGMWPRNKYKQHVLVRSKRTLDSILFEMPCSYNMKLQRSHNTARCYWYTIHINKISVWSLNSAALLDSLQQLTGHGVPTDAFVFAASA
jgi:hypothetical protein